MEDQCRQSTNDKWSGWKQATNWKRRKENKKQVADAKKEERVNEWLRERDDEGCLSIRAISLDSASTVCYAIYSAFIGG